MKQKKKWKLGILIGIVLTAACLFVFRESLLVLGIKWAVETSLHEPFSYDKKESEKKSLTLQGVKVGNFLEVDKLTLEFSWKKPLHLETHVNLSHPKIILDPDESRGLSLGFLLPARWLSLKWSVDEGVVKVIDDARRSFNFNFVEGKTQEEIGVLSFYDKETLASPCVLKFDSLENLVRVQMDMPLTSLKQFLPMHFYKWEKISGAIALQGTLLLDKKGEVVSLSASLKAEHLDLARSNFSCQGKSVEALVTQSAQEDTSFWEQLNVDVTLEKARFALGSSSIFSCEKAVGSVGGAMDVLKKIRCKDMTVTNGYIELPEKKLQGFVSQVQFSGEFKLEEDWKIASLVCDLQEGSLSSQDWAGTSFNGQIVLSNDTFENSFLKGEFKGSPVAISLAGPLKSCEITTELVGDAKEWLALTMGLPFSFQGVTKVHAEGYSFSGHLSAYEEKIELGAEIGLSGELKQGWFCCQKCSEKIVAPFLKDLPLTGEISFRATFDADSLECLIQGEHLLYDTESLEISVPHIGVRDESFLNTEGWAHLRYQFSDKNLKVNFPFKGVSLNTQDITLENLEGDLIFEEGSLKIKDLAGMCQDIQMKADVTCLLSDQGIDLTVNGKSIEGNLETLLALSGIETSSTGRFVGGKHPFRIKSKNILNKAAADIHLEVFCKGVRVPLTTFYQLDNMCFDLVFDSQEKKSSLSHLTGDLVAGDKRYDLMSDSFVYVQEGSPTYLFNGKLQQKGTGFALNLQGQGIKKENAEVAFSLKGVLGTTLLEDMSFILKNGKEVTAFSSKAQIQGKDLVGQLQFLKDFGLISYDFKNFTTLEGIVEGKFAFSPVTGLLFEAGGKNLKVEQEDISHFELKGKKIAEQWILEKMRVGDVYLKGSLLKAQERWFCPYWEVKWKDVVAKGEANFLSDHVSLQVSKIEGVLPPSYTVRSDRAAHLFLSPSVVIKDLSFVALQEGKKTGSLGAAVLTYEKHAWEGKGMRVSLPGFNCPDPFSVSWKDRHLNILVRDKSLGFAFSEKGACEKIKGEFFGLNLQLHQGKKPSLFVGNIKIESGTELSTFYPDVLFLKDVRGIELRGLWEKKERGVSFLGEILGKNISVKGRILENLQAKLEWREGAILVKDLHLSDKAGDLVVKQWTCTQNQDTKKWQFKAPLVRGRDIKPGLLSQKETPFTIRSLVFENLQGELGNLASLTGHGSLNFTNAYKKGSSIFDAPLELVKNFGFDPGLFTPVSGQAFCYLEKGALHFSDLKNTYSEGHRSQFYLDPALSSSYIDLTGDISINLRVKQDVVLKFGEPFVLNIHGDVGHIKYKLR